MNYRTLNYVKVVGGYQRSIMIDLYRQKYHFAPNGILNEIYQLNTNNITNENIKYMIDCGLIYDDKGEVEVLENTHRISKFHIINCVLLIENHLEKLTHIIKFLEDNFCQSIMLYFPENIITGISEVKSVLDLFEYSKIKTIDLLICYDPELYVEINEKIFDMHVRVLNVVFYNSVSNNSMTFENDRMIHLITENGHSVFSKKINPNHFICNSQFYSESLIVNPFFYKKIHLDSNGIIYTHDFERILGNVSNLLNIDCGIIYPYSIVPKSLIKVCSVCEFRNICPDNRVPTMSVDGEWMQIEACDYNPYIAKWKWEEGFISVGDVFV